MGAQTGHIELDRTVASIIVGHRHRTDLGDLDALCESIERDGLLQPLTVTVDGVIHEVPEGQSWAVLDHGRGRWPYSVTWNWAAGYGSVAGRRVGLQRTRRGRGARRCGGRRLLGGGGGGHRGEQDAHREPPKVRGIHGPEPTKPR